MPAEIPTLTKRTLQAQVIGPIYAEMVEQIGEQQATAIQWTLWGVQAENAAAYLGRGSHVNIVGR